MSPVRKYLVMLFIILASFGSCFGRVYRGDPLVANLDEAYGPADPRAYVTPISYIHRQDYEYQPGFYWMKSVAKRFWSTVMRSSQESTRSTSTSPWLVNVDDFGAKGYGKDDSTEAFRKAWEKACNSADSVLVIPANKIYHLRPITFSGPCKSNFTMKVDGKIKASTRRSDYGKDKRHWLVFEKIHNFTVEGWGTIDGNGRKWWANSCKINKKLPCKHAPTAVTFMDCTNLRVADLNIRNAQQIHLSFQNCVNVKALNLSVTAPGNSPNTDGIHVTDTRNITIQDSVISTGDDCISIVSGSEYVQARNIQCGPGHGISIGSLGARNSKDHVSNVIVDGAKLRGTTNGVRIKTWQGGSGYAKNITFQNIEMENVRYPIIIDQNYCDSRKPCTEETSAVQVSGVVYKNITGTSASEEAVKFYCSKTIPCHGISLEEINLVRRRWKGQCLV
ncbi:Polygalacturonase [Morella rubra]|uniref:endo-polygalacturonase n=1 Tax=Morella rubra TaxID=262757 RepID=A0A6A1WI41_9ROSI|nr:Polygalacturonase [Morella rubra]